MIQDGYINGEYVGKVSSKRIEDKNLIKTSLKELDNGEYDKGIIFYRNTGNNIYINLLKEWMSLDLEVDTNEGDNAIFIVTNKIKRLNVNNTSKSEKQTLIIDRCDIKEIKLNRCNLSVENLLSKSIEVINGNITIVCGYNRIGSIKHTGDILKIGENYKENVNNETTIIDKIETNNIRYIKIYNMALIKIFKAVSNKKSIFSMTDDTHIKNCYIQGDDLELKINNYYNSIYSKGNIKVESSGEIFVGELFTKSNVELKADKNIIHSSIEYGNTFNGDVCAKDIVKSGIRDLSNRTGGTIILHPGVTLDLIKLKDTMVIYDEFKVDGLDSNIDGKIIIRQDIIGDSTLRKLQRLEHDILTEYGTKAYYKLLCNNIKFSLVDKIPDSELDIENRINLMYGKSGIAKLLVNAYNEKEDIINNMVEYNEYRTPEPIYREIQFLDSCQDVKELIDDYENLYKYNTERTKIEYTDEVVLEIIKINNISIRVFKDRHSDNIIKAVILPTNRYKASYNYDNRTGYKFADLVAKYVDIFGDGMVGVRYVNEHSEFLDKLVKIFKEPKFALNITVDNKDYYLCSKGFVKFTADNEYRVNDGIVERLDIIKEYSKDDLD